MTGWMARAACRREPDPDVFFPRPGRNYAAAAQWCADCPVTAECLTAALADPHTVGVWGGRLFTGLRVSRAKAAS